MEGLLSACHTKCPKMPVLKKLKIMTKARVISCGILIQVGSKYLICKSSGADTWGIPKGQKNKGETNKECAVREVEEETSIKIEKTTLALFLKYPSKTKDIIVYHTTLQKELKGLFCTTMLPNGKLEIDDYKWVDKQEALMFVRNHMTQIFQKLPG